MVITPAEAFPTSDIQLKNCLSTNLTWTGWDRAVFSSWFLGGQLLGGALKLSGAGTKAVVFPIAPLRHGSD